jgi:hypothetical protein
MNETVIWCWRWGWSRAFARCDLLRRPLVDGAQGPFVQTAGAWFFGSLLLRMSIALAGFYLSPAVIGSGCWPCLLGFVHRAF